MFVLEIAHAHTACNAISNAVFEQLDVRDFFCFGKEVFYLAFGCGEIAVRAETPHVFSDDVMVSKAHIDRVIFFGDELQDLHVGEVVVRDIARDATGIRRQKVAFKEYFEMFAQHGDGAGHWRIEIDMQIADKIVGHALNLYPLILTVKGANRKGILR